jgi:hypothetical protein
VHDIDPSFGHWLAGFIDGEGSFSMPSGARGCAPRFALELRDDDQAILEEIAHRTGIGRTYRRAKRDNAQSQASWQVFTMRDVARLVELLDTYPLRAKKRRDYEIWKEAVRAQLMNGGTRNSGFRTIAYQRKMQELNRRLAAVRAYDESTASLESTEVIEGQLTLPGEPERLEVRIR